MGDEVKITVIATGFRQEMAERRERMLNAALREPVAPRVPVQPVPQGSPRFMSEEEEPEILRPVIPVNALVTATAPVAVQPAVEPAPAPGPVAAAVAEPPAQANTFHEAQREEQPDELDIPAFMRRGGL